MAPEEDIAVTYWPQQYRDGNITKLELFARLKEYKLPSPEEMREEYAAWVDRPVG
jgi:hypothetical protein